jgi:hypothetical protein
MKLKTAAPKPRRKPAGAPRGMKRSRLRPKKRSPEEYARIYGSRARVEWVKAQPCVVCGNLPSENAHTVNGGLSRKGDYQTIIPLCRFDHRLSHGVNGGWSWLGLTPEQLKTLAEETERRWQYHSNRNPE